MKKLRMDIHKYSLVNIGCFLVVITVLMLSIGYSAFNTSMNITGTIAEVRVKEDIRITGISYSEGYEGVISNYEEYNKNNVQMGITFPFPPNDAEDPLIYAMYNVTITNIGNVEMGIKNMSGTGFSDDVAFLLLTSNSFDDVSQHIYQTGTKICDSSGKCTLGSTVTYTLLVVCMANYGYHDLKVDFEFAPIYKVKYNDKTGAIVEEETIGDSPYTLNFGTNIPSSMDSVKMGGVAITDYTYNNSTGELTIPNVTGNLDIKANYQYSESILNGSNPVLSNGLTPVLYDGSNWKVADITKSWHNYSKQEWANAVILKSGITKAVGDTVNVSNEIYGMFVWVPRFEYRIQGTYGKGDTVSKSEVNDTSHRWEHPTVNELELAYYNSVYASTTQGVASSETSYKYNFTLSSSQTISFEWAVSSESNYDYLYYTIIKDGTTLPNTGTSTKISGTTMGESDNSMTYTTVKKELEAGTYELIFTYKKDGSVDKGTDRGYIKNVYLGGVDQNTPGEIEVNFISKTKTTATSGYRVHPAFTFGNTKLSGIWVGKFETGGTPTEPLVLPNISTLQNYNVNTMFKGSKVFDTYINNSSLDAHMSKNSEWGAVAYLSQSKYGKYGNSDYTGYSKEVMKNNCFTSGIASNSYDEFYFNNRDCKNTYETLKGQAASTTGNITGVYDMNGGASEYVMGVYNKTVGKSEIDFNSLDSKYYDNYTTDNSSTACNGGVCYGHALSETKEWYKDSSLFVFSDNAWLMRGNSIYTTLESGIFSSFWGHSGMYNALEYSNGGSADDMVQQDGGGIVAYDIGGYRIVITETN